jgi:hypothetical protein
LAESLAYDEYGWFTPADLKRVIQAIHSLEDWRRVLLVGGQSLTAWVEYYHIQLPTYEGPYLTADADFLATRAEAEVIAKQLQGVATAAALDDNTPNAAIIVFRGEKGSKLHIDILTGVLGVSDRDAKKLAVPVKIYDFEPIQVLHPLLVLESRCVNLECLAIKRQTNGIVQARVACTVASGYISECLADSTRHREALNAASRIAELSASSAGIYVWKTYGIDVMSIVEPEKMPGQFPRSWAYEVERVRRKRDIATRP